METVIVFGGTGLLGAEIVKKLSLTYSVHAPSRAEFDITDYGLDRLRRYIAQYRPKYVVNCAGVLVAEAMQDMDRATRINTVFPQSLGVVCKEQGTKLLHFSTNCVFKGKDSGRCGYLPWDVPDSDDPYGITKAGGESESYVTIRTTFIGYSSRKNDTGLLNWFLNSGPSIKGHDVQWDGVTTLDIADHLFFFLSLGNGIYHFSDSRSISKFDLLQKCNRIFGLDKQIELVHGRGMNKKLIPSWENTLPTWDMRIERMKGSIERGWVG